MWGLYADKGYGACLVFDKNKLKLAEGDYARDVEYMDYVLPDYAFRNKSKKGLKSEIWRKRDDIFFCKRKEWEYEQEYRVIRRAIFLLSIFLATFCCVFTLFLMTFCDVITLFLTTFLCKDTLFPTKRQYFTHFFQRFCNFLTQNHMFYPTVEGNDVILKADILFSFDYLSLSREKWEMLHQKLRKNAKMEDFSRKSCIFAA